MPTDDPTGEREQAARGAERDAETLEHARREPPAREVAAHALWRREARERNLAGAGETMAHARRRQRRADAAARAVAVGAPRSQAAAGELSTFAEGWNRPNDIAGLYGALIARATERVELLSRQLAAAYAAEGESALVGSTWATDEDGHLVETGEQPRALVVMERQAARDLQELIVTAVKLKIDAESSSAKMRYSSQMVAMARSFCEQMGWPWNDDTRRMAQAAVIAARRTDTVPTTE